MGKVDSHIQVPNGILKYFRDETRDDKQIWVLDLKTGNVLHKASRKLGTEYGYYTENGEQFLDQNIESPITGVNAKIREFATSARPEISLDEKELKSILLYIKSSLARSNLACKEFNDHSITAQLFPDAVNHDQLVEFSIKTQGPIDDILKSLSVGILINETSKTFVIPRNCIYVVHSNDRPAIIAPIAPKVAYILIPNDCKDSKEILVVEKESDIIAMNHQALMYEYIFNYDFVAANNREDIDELKIFLGKNRAILENIKNSIQSIQ